MKTLILWADELSPNLGVRVLGAGTEVVVRRIFPESSVDIQFKGYPNTLAPRPASLKALLPELVRPGEVSRWLAEYDLIIDTGSGDSFSDIYGNKRLALMSSMRVLAARGPARVVMGPQTIGPYTTGFGARIAARSLRRVDKIFARDPTSQLSSRRDLGVEAVLTTDVVFALPVPTPVGERDVIFNPSGLLWAGSPHTPAEPYRAACIEFCRRVIEHGRRVTLLAHVLGNTTPDDDVPACSALSEALGDQVEVCVPSSLDEARSTLAGGRVVVGSRMHACLNSLSVGVPAIPWAYSRKFGPLMEQIGWTATVDLAKGDPVARTLQLVEEVGAPSSEALVALKASADANLRVFEDAIRDLVGMKHG